MKKPSTFLRRLLWLGMTVLVLLAAVCGLRLWLDASARQTLTRLGVKPEATSGSTSISMPARLP